MRLVDVASGKEVRALATEVALAGCCFSPDTRFVAGWGDRGLVIWDTATGSPLASCHGHRGPVSAAAFSADGGTLVSAGLDGTFLLWDVATLLAPSAPTAKR